MLVLLVRPPRSRCGRRRPAEREQGRPGFPARRRGGRDHADLARSCGRALRGSGAVSVRRLRRAPARAPSRSGAVRREREVAHDLTVRARFTGLVPATRYHYGFPQGGVASPPGTFTTAPRIDRSVERALRDSPATPTRPRGRTGSRVSTASRSTRPMARGERLQHQPRRHDLLGQRGRRRAGRAHRQREVGEVPARPRARPRCDGFAPLGRPLQPLGRPRVRQRLLAAPSTAAPSTRAGVKAFTDYAPVAYRPRTGSTERSAGARTSSSSSSTSARSAAPRQTAVCGGDLAPTAPQAVRHAFAALAPGLEEPGVARHVSPRSTTRADDARQRVSRRLSRARSGVDGDLQGRRQRGADPAVLRAPVRPLGGICGRARAAPRRFLQGVRNVVFLTTDTHANLIDEVRYQTLGGAARSERGSGRSSPGRSPRTRIAKEIDASSASRVRGGRSAPCSSSRRRRTGSGCTAPHGHLQLRGGERYGHAPHGLDERRRAGRCARPRASPAPRSSSARRDGRVTEAHPYRELLGLPHAKALVGWSLLGRLPLGMTRSPCSCSSAARARATARRGSWSRCTRSRSGSARPIGGRQVDRYGPAPCCGSAPCSSACSSPWSSAPGGRRRGHRCHRGRGGDRRFSMPPVSSTVRIVWPRLARASPLDGVRARGDDPGGASSSSARCSPPRSRRSSRSRRRRRRARVPRRHDRSRGSARPRDASVARRRRGRPRRARRRRACGRSSATRRWSGLGVRLGRARDARVRGGARGAGAGRVALACFSAGSLVGGFLAGLRPSGSDLRRFVGGAFGLSAAGCSRSSSLSRSRRSASRVRRRACRSPRRRRPVHADRPLGACGHGRRGVRLVRHGGLGRHRNRGGGRRRPRRRARRPLVVRARSRDRVGRRRPRVGAPWNAPGRRCYRSQVMPSAAYGVRGPNRCRAAARADRLPSLASAPVAQGTERRTSNPRVGGSNPPGRIGRRARRMWGDGERDRSATPRGRRARRGRARRPQRNGHGASPPKRESRTSGRSRRSSATADIVLSVVPPGSAVEVAKAIATAAATHGRSSRISTRSRRRLRGAVDEAVAAQWARNRRRLDLGRAAACPGDDADLPVGTACRRDRWPSAAGGRARRRRRRDRARVGREDVHRVGLQGAGRAPRAGAPHGACVRGGRARPRRPRRHRARGPAADGRDDREGVGEGVALRARDGGDRRDPGGRRLHARALPRDLPRLRRACGARVAEAPEDVPDDVALSDVLERLSAGDAGRGGAEAP